jgi:dTDP-4-amino-4,6-dideoxygalactose transaminase
VNIPIFRPKLPTYDELEFYLRQIDVNRQYSNFGPLSRLLQERFSEHVGASIRNTATCVNATIALTGASQLLNPSGRPWKLPVYTFVATAQAVMNAGQEFDLQDITTDLHMDNANIRNDDYVLHVLPFGDSFPANSYQHFEGDMLIDAAASYDAVSDFALKNHFRGRVVVVVSLHPTKYPGGAEGALVYSNDEKFIEMFNQWTVFGFDKSRQSLRVGTNAKINEYAAAVANASLDRWFDRRNLIRAQMEKAFSISQAAGLKVHPAMERGFINPYWIISTENHARLEHTKVILNKLGIEYRMWWGEGVHKHPYFMEKLRWQTFPTCERIINHSVALPFFEELTEVEFGYIESALWQL